MSKWGTIIVEGIDNNGPRHYPLDDKERNITKFPKKKKRVGLYKNYKEHQEEEEEEMFIVTECHFIPYEYKEIGVQTEDLWDVGVQTNAELPHIEELLSKI